MESELFGHERGAFTGATTSRQGKFELAAGGTIMLDEIGEMVLPMQAKLLRVLQERSFQRVGGSREIHANVRILAATNRDLAGEITTNHFREDLFYRLNVFPIYVPPLRDRKDDIPLLAEYFLKKNCAAKNKPLKRITKKTMDKLIFYSWPGNVRELENCIERIVTLVNKDDIEPEDVVFSLIEANINDNRDDSSKSLDEIEKEHLLRVLNTNGWNKEKAAAILGINRSTLFRKLKRYEINDRQGT